MFSHWTETFPCRKATDSSATKVLLEKIIPLWRTPLKLPNDRGPPFTGHLLPQVCTIRLVLQHFHRADQPHSSGLVWFKDIIKWGNSGNSVRLYFWGLQNHCRWWCSHEIKRLLLLGRKVMTNLDSILKSRDITLPTKVSLANSMVFPVVMYGYES